MIFTTSPKRTDKAFTISAGKMVTLEKMTIDADQQIYFQFRDGSKTKWISGDSGQFRDVMSRCAGGFYGYKYGAIRLLLNYKSNDRGRLTGYTHK